jgi:hypothetical protein
MRECNNCGFNYSEKHIHDGHTPEQDCVNCDLDIVQAELAAVRADLAEAVAALNRTSEALSQANGDDRLEKIHGEIIAANDAIIAKHTKGIS